jgi:hypothetical protein
MAAPHRLLLAAIVLATLATSAAAETVYVELRIAEFHVADADGGDHLRNLLSHETPPSEISGDRADRLVAELNGSFRPRNDYRIEVPIHPGRGSNFRVQNGKDYAAGKLTLQDTPRRGEAIVLAIDLVAGTSRSQSSAVHISDGTPGKTFVVMLGGLDTSRNNARGKTLKESTRMIAVAKVISREADE